MSWTVSEFSKTVQEQTGLLYVTNPFEVEKAPISDPLFKKEQSVLAAKLQDKITGLYNFETNENPNVIILPDQYFAALTNMRSVGVMGDERTYDYAVALRAVNTVDFMTAECAQIPFETLQTVMSRIINEVRGVNRVFYDLTSKPPGTIELE